jgi:cysteinyl-tRNA synthetase
MQANYRSVLDFSGEALLAAEKGHSKLMEALRYLESATASKSSSFDVNTWISSCYDAMNDDFNTPVLISNLFEGVKFINQMKTGKGSLTQEDLVLFTSKMQAFINDVLGLFDDSTNDNSDKLKGTVELLIELRKKARENKDWALSDQIRDELLELGIQLKDGREGTTFSIN